MHELLPEPADGERIYRATVKGLGAKPSTWHGFVVADSEEGAKGTIREGYLDISLGIQGIEYIKLTDRVSVTDLEDRIMSAFHPNSVVFRNDDGEVVRVHRGMLKED